jgi:hypothetical protein
LEFTKRFLWFFIDNNSVIFNSRLFFKASEKWPAKKTADKIQRKKCLKKSNEKTTKKCQRKNKQAKIYKANGK